MNSLFSEFFKEVSGVILGVYEAICRVPWGCLGVILKVFGGNLRGKIKEKRKKKEPNRLFNIALYRFS